MKYKEVKDVIEELTDELDRNSIGFKAIFSSDTNCVCIVKSEKPVYNDSKQKMEHTADRFTVKKIGDKYFIDKTIYIMDDNKGSVEDFVKYLLKDGNYPNKSVNSEYGI